ncbi:glycosyltransferase [uncultured Sulfurimonas sp.]|uniref:glycosyltransferase n=1 Tax=uncultured Sulfurimonas sp. TaxID=291845 RepID=UPI0032B2DA71
MNIIGSNNIAFDQFQRYKTASFIIEQNRTDSILKVLEIGANEHKNLEKFLPTDEIQYLDIQLSDLLKNDKQYILADATNMPEIETDSFDVVIALDVFEHIPKNLRNDFLDELNRVSKNIVVLAGPYDELGVNKAEVRVNAYFKTKYGIDYSWLDEHISNGLPNLDETLKYLNDKKLQKITHFKHGTLELWEKLIRVHFEVSDNLALQEYRQNIDTFYNENIFSYDVGDECYRDFIVIGGKDIELKSYFKSSLNQCLKLNILDELVSSCYTLSIEKKVANIQEKDQQIQEKDQQIQEKDQQIQEFIKAIDDKEVHIQEKESQIQEFIKAIDDKEVHIQEKESQIQEFIKAIDDKEVHIQNQNNEITHLHHVAQSLRLKNRLKRIIKIFIPNKLWKILRYIKHNPNAIKLGLHILKTQGIKALLSKVNKVEALSEERIENTYTYIEPKYSTEVEQTINEFKKKPLISIIMPVYNVDPKWLELAIESIKNQWYENWELCIVDDKSTNKKTLDYLKNIKHKKIKIKFLENNLNISGASNEALKLVSGEYVALMDNDDEITPNALYEVVKVINETGSEFVYSDEDKLEVNGIFSDPHFKPDFAPDMFLSQNYMSHFGVIKKELIDKVDGFTIGLEGAQDYDLYLKVLEHTDKIYHIQKVLYHWRKIPGSTASEFGEKSYAQEAGRKALENAMNRRKIDAIVINGLTAGTYKVEYKIIGTPLVSIIIPFKDRPDLLTMCIESILNKSTYKNFEIIGISNNSEENKTFKEMKRLESLDDRIKFHEYNVPFNYSDINNHAVEKYADGEHLLFLNNDIEVITPKWIEELLMHSQREVVGAVGAKLYFPDNTIQHAGLAIAPYTMHSVIIMYSRHSRDEYGYVSRAKCINNYSAVTAACMMIKKNIFIQFNGFDSEKLKIAYNDVDLCLTMIENNKQNIFTPYCELYHYESVSRGYETKRIDKERAEKEKYYLKEKHSVFYKKDKFYNPNLSLYGVDSSFNLSNSIHYKALVGLPFEEKIILKEKINTKRKNRVCIFSHFDKNNIVNKYVLYYLSELSKVSDIIFVSTSEGLQNTDSLKLYCRDIIVKENYGYDFGAWKSGLNLLGNELEDYEELILCNDSMFGPFYELEPIFNKMSNSYDVWSMTDNMQIAHHLQSFFVVYNKKAFQHKLFKDFWNNFKIYIDKQKLIEMNEIKFSEELLKCKDLRVGSYVEARELDSFLNITHYYWDELLSKYKFPFIKKELLRDNPMNLDTSNWKEVIESTSDYNTKLIIDVLEKS